MYCVCNDLPRSKLYLGWGMKSMCDHHRKRHEQEKAENVMKCFFMSFVNPDKPEGQRALGVCIVDALGVSHAMQKTWDLGINPSGEIKSYEVPISEFKQEHKNRFLTHELLIEYELIEVH